MFNQAQDAARTMPIKRLGWIWFIHSNLDDAEADGAGATINDSQPRQSVARFDYRANTNLL
jgi:hypothetical protein